MREMKDSEIEWIGCIPKDWGINTIFQLCTQVKNKNLGLQEKNLLSLSYGKIKRKNIDTVEGLLPESFDGYNIIDKDDIVLRLTDLQNDHTSLRVGISEERGIITSAYLTLRNRGDFVPKYLYYYLYSFDISKGFYGMGAGVRQGLNWDGVKWLQVLAPLKDEQGRIATFLDIKCAKIDAVLEKTRASIDEYKKLKQAVITQAVTKGIRGDRPMKDSGIEWTSSIPYDVSISRIGLHFNIILGKMLCLTPLDETYTLESYYCAADVHFEGISKGEKKRMWFNPTEKQQYLVNNGDLLVVEGGAGAGGCAIVRENDKQMFIQNSIMIVRPKEQSSTRYLRYLMECFVKQGYIDVVCNKATIPHFTKDKLSTMPYIVFSVDEQKEIADYLDVKCAEIDNLISKKEQYITEIENYKKSLIYEYVTGKKECPAMVQNEDVSNAYPYFPAPVHASSARFAQAVLMSKILEESSKGMGRVKLEKTLFTIENHIGFNFDTEYLREAAGPLDASIYECEKIITRRNKWFSMKTSSYGVSYAPTNDVDKYKKYYAKYFSEYNSEIERIIDVFRNYTTEQAEIIATLFAAWNDAIIDKKQFTDDDIVDDVLNNWHESKRRFPRQVWLRAMNEIRKNHIIPKGYGKHTVMKEMQ